MAHRLAICLAIASSILAAPRPAAAAITHVFDTVDAVEISGTAINVTGILAGQTAPTTVMFEFYDAGRVQRCERLAVLAMSKPGKYQFGIGGPSGPNLTPSCKLALRTP